MGVTDLTEVADIIQPSIWLPYTINRTTELSELVTSGIIEASPQFDALAAAAGSTINMPYWNDLSGDDEVIQVSGSLSTGQITTGQDNAVHCIRGKAWANHDLAGILAGSDPAGAMGELVAAYWARRLQARVLALLTGVFAAASMASNVLALHHTSGGPGGATDANRLNASTFIDACQLMGDAKAKLSAIIMHSKVEASLAKQQLIDYIPSADGTIRIPTFKGHRVIVDDGMPVATVDSELVYTTYIFGRGAIAYGNGRTNPEIPGAVANSKWELEFFRDALGSVSGFVQRNRTIVHIRGVRWIGSLVGGNSPNNSQLATGTNWEAVYDHKNIRVVKVTHNIQV